MSRVERLGQRCLMIGALILSLAVVLVVQSAAGQDEMRQLLEALWMEIPAKPVLAPSFVLPS